MNKIICLVGMPGSGKTLVSDIFAKNGFSYVRFGQITLDIIKERGLEVNETNEKMIRESLRKEHGMAAYAKLNLPKFKSLIEKENVIADGLYSWDEYKLLREHFGEQLIVLSIYSPPELRYERLAKRKIDPNDQQIKNRPFLPEESKSRDISEIENLDKGGPIAMADYTLTNTGTLSELKKECEVFCEKFGIKIKIKRPGWDEYFMEMAKVVGKRGTCDRGRSGCVIVRNKRVMTSGYVGSPPKLAHCDDVGHWFKKTIHEDGNITQHCIRTVHAEANAIAQAAKNGINIDGSTLYCKLEPCLDCTKLLISSGIKRIFCENRYHGAQESREMLEEAGVKLEVLHDEFGEYVAQQDKEEGYKK